MRAGTLHLSPRATLLPALPFAFTLPFLLTSCGPSSGFPILPQDIAPDVATVTVADGGPDACADSECAVRYSVSGTVEGRFGDGLMLLNNERERLAINGAGAFAFRTLVNDGDAYDVTVLNQAEGDDCVVLQGSGIIRAEAVSDILVQCNAMRILEFSADAQVVLPGDTVRLTWAVDDADSCLITATPIVGGPVEGEPFEVSPTEFGTAEFTVNTSTSFSLACEGSTGPYVRSVDVQVADSDWTRIARGPSHSCAITSAGELFCWGTNTFGQLGDGSTASSQVPAQEMTLGANWAEVSVAGNHTCATTNDDELFCWGANERGQVGIGSTEDQPVPTQVDDDVAWSTVAVGLEHTCAISVEGQAYCWGANDIGQAGVDDVDEGARVLAPALVAEFDAEDESWSQIATGSDHTCALSDAGNIDCWGANDVGQLGSEVAPDPGSPARVEVAFAWTDLAAGDHHTCAVNEFGEIWCWGNNEFSSLGSDSDALFEATPVQESTLGTQWAEVSAGSHASCGMADGEAYCWGSLNWQHPDVETPTRVEAPDPAAHWAQLAPSRSLCGLTSEGAAVCVGIDAQQQTHIMTPSVIFDTTDTWWQVSCGSRATCGITINGGAQCWGVFDNSAAQPTLTPTPTIVGDPATRWTDFDTSANARCGVSGSGQLFCWGANSTGQLGVGDTDPRSAPTREFTQGTDWARVDLANGHACGITHSGELFCWGQTPLVATSDIDTVPRQVVNPATGWLAVGNGDGFGCGISRAAQLYCWGQNGERQLGDLTRISRNTVEPVGGTERTWTSVSVGDAHSCAISDTGRALCWGYNRDGQLGIGTSRQSRAPVHIEDPSRGASGGLNRLWQSVSAGATSTCGVTTRGELFCWGDNDEAQLGDGTFETRYVPTQEPNRDGNFVSVSVGDSHACAIRIDGRLSCWGALSSAFANTLDPRPISPRP